MTSKMPETAPLAPPQPPRGWGQPCRGWSAPADSWRRCIEPEETPRSICLGKVLLACDYQMAAPRALASVLAVVLEDMDLYTLGDFADFLDGGFDAVQLLVSRIRSDDIVAALHISAASDVMGVARAAAELRLLNCELHAMEESVSTLQLHAARGADAMADKLILHEQLSKATAELVSTRQAAARRHEALKSTQTELAAAKPKLAIAVQGRDAAELEVQAAKKLGVALLDAKQGSTVCG